MNRMLQYLLSLALLISLSVNAYLYLQAAKWEEAWLSQFVSTSTVEQLLRALDADLSYARVASLMPGAVPVEASSASQATGADKAALAYVGTLFLFKDGIYFGSKTGEPNH